MSKEYEVKLIVTETHYLQIDADSKDEAMQKAENYGVMSMDADDTDVESVNAWEIEEVNGQWVEVKN